MASSPLRLILAGFLIASRGGECWPCDTCSDQGEHGERLVSKGPRRGIFQERDRGGFNIFRLEHPDPADFTPEPSLCRPVHIIQVNHEPPSADSIRRIKDKDIRPAQLKDNWELSLLDRTFMINCAYAAIHGYSYTFFVSRASARNAMWSKVPAISYVLKECPDSYVLSLDTDAYIRNIMDPLDYNTFPSLGRTMAMSLECAWFSAGGNTECTDMNGHQRVSNAIQVALIKSQICSFARFLRGATGRQQARPEWSTRV